VTVAELQQALRHLGGLLQAAGVKGSVLADVNAMQEALTPFGAMPLRKFAEFLVHAQVADRDRRAEKGGPARPPGTRARATAAVDPGGTAQRLRQLYERAADPNLTDEEITQELEPLRRLTKAGLITVAEALDLQGMGRKKVDEIREAVGRHIRGRRAAAQRVSIMDPLPLPRVEAETPAR
jgi:hypothetical protein